MAADGPSPHQVALSKARKLHIKQLYAEAAVAYGAALGGADDEDVLESRGCCYLNAGQPDKALADFERVPSLRFRRAKALVALGRRDEALGELKKDLASKAPSKYSKEYLTELLGETKPAKPAAKPKPKTEPKTKPSTLAEPAPIPTRKKGEGYDAYVMRLLAAAGLGAHARAIEAARVPGVLLLPSKKPARPGASRLGGLPDLPPKAKWPSHGGAPMLFVMQVRLEDVAPLLKPKTLPAAGLLSFFVCEGSHGDYLDAGAVVFTPGRASSGVAPAALPKGFARMFDGKKVNKPFGSRSLELVSVRKLPNPDGPELSAAKIPSDVRARYSQHVFERAMASEEGGRHQLLGVRDRSYPGDQPKSTTLLLQCVTEPGIDMHWGDDDTISIFVPRAGLSKADFKRVVVSYGD